MTELPETQHLKLRQYNLDLWPADLSTPHGFFPLQLLPGLPILQEGRMSHELKQSSDRSEYEYLCRWPCSCRLILSCGYCNGKGYLEEWLPFDAALMFRPVTFMGYRLAGIPNSSRMYSQNGCVIADGPTVTASNTYLHTIVHSRLIDGYH